MKTQKPNFPFSAVTGQTLFKLALTLVAANPAIGGVLVSGPRGSAKSTLAKGLADLMPETDSKITPAFVTLPLSVTEDMVVGTLDLQQVLNERNVEFRSGLLAKADNGILYVDEVNLLQDHIVDLLLDAAASGVNVVERDGISHSHDANFILLGTMNPDEGELRPQLQDRFGLSVELSNEYNIAERVEVVQRREAFDANGQSFIHGYAKQQDALKNKILETRACLSNVECAFELQELIATKCHDAQVDGLRADIVWYRAAITHAALHRRLAVTVSDIDAVEELVLNHRRKNDFTSQMPPDTPQESSGSGSEKPQKPFSRPKAPANTLSKDTANDDASDNETKGADGDWGMMKPVHLQTAESTEFKLPSSIKQQLTKIAYKKDSTNTTAKGRASAKQSMPSPSMRLANQGHNESNKVNWLSSFLANAGHWPLRHLRFYQRRNAKTILHLVLIDTSASTLRSNLFSHAKAVVLNIAEQAYIDREQLSIVGFGNQAVRTLLPRQRAPKVLREFLDNVPAAGGTPFREALEHTSKFQRQQLRQTPSLCIKTYIITDGKTRQSFSDVDLIGNVTLIDIERSAVSRGKGRHIANDLNAMYVPLFS